MLSSVSNASWTWLTDWRGRKLYIRRMSFFTPVYPSFSLLSYPAASLTGRTPCFPRRQSLYAPESSSARDGSTICAKIAPDDQKNARKPRGLGVRLTLACSALWVAPIPATVAACNRCAYSPSKDRRRRVYADICCITTVRLRSLRLRVGTDLSLYTDLLCFAPVRGRPRRGTKWVF